MAVRVIPVQEALDRWGEFHAVIDARSPGEFALDRLPEAQNWPVLDDEERRAVGTEYKQVSAFDARKQGAALVARRIAGLIELHLTHTGRDWQPLVYCWRGGQRSGTLAWFLDQVGFRTHLLQGGYKAFRAHVRQDTAARVAGLSFVVIGGRTGSGKSRLLQHLRHEGAQVLDLEDLACHRGSVLGALPDRPQPSQKHFETRVWAALRAFDPARPVFVESESRKIGQMQVPTELIERMRIHGRMVRLEMPLAARVDLLLEDYRHFAQAPESFVALLRHFTELQGHERVARWREHAMHGRWAELYAELVQQHYDPLYDRSMAQNYRSLDAALPLAVDSGDEKALREAAQGLIRSLG